MEKRAMSKKTVLLVDDDLITLESLKLALRPYYEVIRALQPKDGLTLAHNCNPDLIVLDISMPKMSGFDFIESFRRDAEPEFVNTPFILLSSFKSVQYIARAEELGVAHFLEKPIDEEGLLLALEYELNPENR